MQMPGIITPDRPELHQVASPVPHGESVHEIVGWMFHAMTVGRGIGLAANQIGILQRIIVVHAGPFKQAIINPVITRRYGGKHTASEGCLSFPGLTKLVVRDMQIAVEGFDQNWKPVRFRLRGLAARVVQHEVDHLDGKTIADPVRGAA